MSEDREQEEREQKEREQREREQYREQQQVVKVAAMHTPDARRRAQATMRRKRRAVLKAQRTAARKGNGSDKGSDETPRLSIGVDPADNFGPNAREKALKVRRRNIKLRKAGKLPYTAKQLARGYGRTQENRTEMAFDAAESVLKQVRGPRGPYKKVGVRIGARIGAETRPIPMQLVARLIIELADAYQTRGRK